MLVERKRHAETESEGAFVIRHGLAFVSLRRSVLRQRTLCVLNTVACPSLSSQAYEQYINNSAYYLQILKPYLLSQVPHSPLTHNPHLARHLQNLARGSSTAKDTKNPRFSSSYSAKHGSHQNRNPIRWCVRPPQRQLKSLRQTREDSAREST